MRCATCQGDANPVPGMTEVINMTDGRGGQVPVVHQVLLCKAGHRSAVPKFGNLGPQCPNCGFHAPPVVAQGGAAAHIPGGIAPFGVRVPTGMPTHAAGEAIAKALGLGGSA